MTGGIVGAATTTGGPRRVGRRPRRRPPLSGLGLAATIVAVLVLAACSNSSGDGATTATPAATAAPAAPGAPALQQDYRNVVTRVLPSVVEITNGKDLGSGIVFDDRGDLVTNAHVVGSATRFQVRLAGTPTGVGATLVGAYPPDDLAVIHLDNPPAGLVPAHFGDSAGLQVGDIVLAMGNPLGLSGTVTNGIVSATGRTVSEPQTPGSPGATLPDTIQTSAAINPGNSGGALVDLAGDVIGIPTLAALDPQTGGSPAPGIGFAISARTVTDIAGQITTQGRVTNSHRADLGVEVATVLGAGGAPAGAGIAAVTPGGPAATAGLRPGEVITGINTTAIHTTAELSAALAGLDPGQTVTLTLADPNATTRTVTVTLGQLPGT